MTSGVKQALPQVLMPKTGVEGKAARNRAPQGDFAEALGLGKFARQLKSGEAKADRHDVEAGPALPRLAAKLDTAIDRTQGIASKLEVAVGKPTEEGPADSELAAGKDIGLTRFADAGGHYAPLCRSGASTRRRSRAGNRHRTGRVQQSATSVR